MKTYTLTEDQIRNILSRLNDADDVISSVEVEPTDYTKSAYYANGFAQSSIRGTILSLLKVLDND